MFVINKQGLKGIQKFRGLLFLLLISTLIFSIGCEQKKPEEVSVPKDTVQVRVEEPAPVDTTKLDTTTVAKEPEVVIPDLKGKWTGTFDSKPATFRINEQTNDKLSGTISVQLRELTSYLVTGKLDFNKLEINLRDAVQSRNQGKYNAKLSKDYMTISGTYKKDVDGSKANFKFNKSTK